MIEKLKKLLGLRPATDYAALIAGGAMIIDVRSRGEFSSGHVKGSVNIPVDQLHQQLGKLKKKEQPLITCCASGMRSASARSFLQSQGYTNVHNAGPWQRLVKYVK